MILFWLITLGAVVFIFGVNAYGNLKKIEEDWGNYRCDPRYMPFAGMIDPETGTAGNFQHCMNLMGKSVVGGMSDALNSQFSIIADMLKSISDPIAIFRTMITTMRKFIVSFASSTLGKASGPVSMFVYYLNKIQDLIRRIVGEGYIGIFFGVTAISFIQGFVMLVIAVIKGFVIAMLAISVILALFQPEILAIVLVIASLLAAAGI
jgi:hypothetical protein